MIPLSSIKKENKKEAPVYIDLNCDIGQSYGVYKNELELDLLPYVSSVNISCGLHAGDPLTIKQALKHASDNGLAIGAHIGYPDIQGFGYREMKLSDEELQAVVIYQIGALVSLAKTYDVQVEHVRPHGSLYKQAAQDYEVSLSIAKAIAKFDPWLIYVGAASEQLEKVSEETNVRVAGELLLDKSYKVDGTIDFDKDDIVDADYSNNLLESIVKASCVKNEENGMTKVKYSTIHLNMKSQIALELAKKAKDLIKNPVPASVAIVEDRSWI